MADMRISVIDTSYEIVCATLRREPRSAYFELEAQPAIITGYTDVLEMVMMSSAPNGRIKDLNGCGYRVHRSSAMNKLNTGAMINGARLEVSGVDHSLVNSLMASANGCGRPAIPTLFGPFRV